MATERRNEKKIQWPINWTFHESNYLVLGRWASVIRRKKKKKKNSVHLYLLIQFRCVNSFLFKFISIIGWWIRKNMPTHYTPKEFPLRMPCHFDKMKNQIQTYRTSAFNHSSSLRIFDEWNTNISQQILPFEMNDLLSSIYR